MAAVDDHHANTSTAAGSDAERIAGTDSPGTGNLEKVRDILFGNQMRDVDRRFARLEERIIKDTRDLKEDITRRLDALEAHAAKETETLAGDLRHERTDRLESNARLSRELADAAGAFERRSATIEEHMARGQREIRQHILEQQQRLSDDMRGRIEEVLAALARESSELRNDKTDRMALASLLKEMAMRLSDEFKLPGVEGGGNG